jgi:hypothetical protein
MSLRLLVALVAVALLATGVFSVPQASAAASAELQRPEVTCLSSNVASVRFTWTPAAGATQQWLDLSTTDLNWAQGSFTSAGPFEATSTSYTWQGIKGGAPHFWRINSLTPDGWSSSQTAAFVPCPTVINIGATVFKFGDGVSEADRTTIRNSIDSVRAYGVQTLGAEANKMSVFAYDNLEQLAEAMSTWAGSPGYYSQFHNLWQNTNTAAVTYGNRDLGDAFFVYAGGPIWKSTTSGDIYRLIGHEYFHVLQRQLTKYLDRGPNWLVEGSAEAFGWWAYLYKANLEQSVLHDAFVSDSKGYGGPLKALEEQAVFNSSGYAAYANGMLATDLATKGKGLRAVADFYRAIGTGTRWQDAFTRSFGSTPEFFYDQYEAYRAAGFK